MQQASYRPRSGANSNQLRKVLLTVCTVVALLGLVIGFTVGAFTRGPKEQPGGVANNNQSTPTATGTTPVAVTPTPTPTSAPVTALGCPDVTAPFSQIADSATTYTITVQAQDTGKSCSIGQKAVKMKDIACKLWLVQSIGPNDGMTLPENLTIDTITPSITGHLEKGNAEVKELPYLTFDPSTPQLQKTDENGLCTWKYTLPATTPAKVYSLIALNLLTHVTKPPFTFYPITVR